jgi:cobalt-zinc-cadmium efflux system outer membrane protein
VILSLNSTSMLRIFLTALLLGGAGVLPAANLTVEAAVTQAVSRNPGLLAARWSVVEANGRLLQTGRPANPEIETELKPNVRGREFTFSAGFMQRFPLTNRLRLEKAVSRAEVDVAAAEVREAERQLAAQVRTVAVKVLAVRAAQELKKVQAAQSADMVKAAAKAAEAAEGSSLDAAQLELEQQQGTIELQQLEGEQAALTAGLRPLLGMAPDEPLEIAGSLPPPAGGEAGNGLNPQNRPDYQAAQARGEAARQNLELERKSRWEDPAFGVSAELERAEDAPEGLRTEGFVGFKFSLPLPFWNKNEGRIEAAQAASARADLEAAALASTIRAEAATARAEMTAAARIYDQAANTLLPRARDLEAKLLELYRKAGPGADLATVLRARERRMGLETARLNALRDYHLAKARLRSSLGGVR